eukprot:9462668-Alexandrium_andersonii.AAC.1
MCIRDSLSTVVCHANLATRSERCLSSRVSDFQTEFYERRMPVSFWIHGAVPGGGPGCFWQSESRRGSQNCEVPRKLMESVASH